MRKIRFIGDIHGNARYYSDITEVEYETIQVGDYGMGFGMEQIFFPAKDRFIRGNHDDPDKCKKSPNWIPDGLVDGKMMFVGGAWSIDRDTRIEGVDWWPDEELTIAELSKILDIYEKNKPEIMVTHDCPSIMANQILLSEARNRGYVKKLFPNRTVQALDAMYEIHKPKMWIFGHWHKNMDTYIDKTMFVCIGIDSHIDLEI